MEPKRSERPEGPERRFFAPGLRVERREVVAGAEPRQAIVGHAAVFDQWTTLCDGEFWQWREIARPGCFRRAIAEGQDVKSLFNHNNNYVFGRTTSGTLRLSEDGVGLFTETDPPDAQWARDVLVSVDRRDISGMSFAFSTRRAGQVEDTVTRKDGVTVIENAAERITLRYDGQKLIEERELLDVDLYDVSIVTDPQYLQTDVALRSLIEKREREIRSAAPRGTPRRDLAERRIRLALAD